jgi:hypothetical protein
VVQVKDRAERMAKLWVRWQPLMPKATPAMLAARIMRCRLPSLSFGKPAAAAEKVISMAFRAMGSVISLAAKS